MRFGLVHRVMTDALAALGVLAVVSTASLSPWTNLAPRRRARARDRHPRGLAGAARAPPLRDDRAARRCSLVQGARLLAGRSPLDVAVEFAALLQIVRLATRRGAAHDQQIIVLALLHFVAGTVLGGGLTYGICFLGFLVVAPGALVLSHLRREVEGNYRQGARDRTGPARRRAAHPSQPARRRPRVPRGHVPALGAHPRSSRRRSSSSSRASGLSLLLLNHPHAGRMIGFSEHVDLGDVGVLRDDPTIALRFEVKDLPEPPTARSRFACAERPSTRTTGAPGSARSATCGSADHGLEGTDVYPIFRGPEPRATASSRSTSSPSTRRSSSCPRAPSRCA